MCLVKAFALELTYLYAGIRFVWRETSHVGASGVRRVGILIGDSDPLVEYDLQRFLPRSVSFHVGRLDMPDSAKLAADDSLQMMCDSAPEAARKVAAAGVELFVFACTSASFFRGKGWDGVVARAIEDATGIPAITTATAAADAIEALPARRVFLATPYAAEVNAREVAFLGDRGIDVVGQYSFGCVYSSEVSLVPPATIKEALLAERPRITAADALFISCTMLRSMEIAEDLEQELRLPVVTSNTASVWAILRMIGEDMTGVRAGALFRRRLAGDQAEPSVVCAANRS